MKLAEALLLRKELKTKVDQLRGRASQNVMVQEGDVPAELPADLLRVLATVVDEWGALVQRINATNNVAILADGTTLSNAIVQRDMLDMRRNAVDLILNQAVVRQERYSRNEIKFVATIAAASLRRDLDELAKARRELDTQIQALNWNVDLIEVGA
jgi:hypothetical protein